MLHQIITVTILLGLLGLPLRMLADLRAAWPRIVHLLKDQQSATGFASPTFAPCGAPPGGIPPCEAEPVAEMLLAA